MECGFFPVYKQIINSYHKHEVIINSTKILIYEILIGFTVYQPDKNVFIDNIRKKITHYDMFE